MRHGLFEEGDKLSVDLIQLQTFKHPRVWYLVICLPEVLVVLVVAAVVVVRLRLLLLQYHSISIVFFKFTLGIFHR